MISSFWIIKQLYFNWKLSIYNYLFLFYCEFFYAFIILIIAIFIIFLEPNFKKSILIENSIYKLSRKKITNLNFILFVLFFIFYFLFYFNNIFKFSNIWYSKKIVFIKNTFDLSFSFDYVNIYFFLLTFFIFMLIFLSVNSTKFFYDINAINQKIIIFLFLLIEIFLLLTFLTSNVFFFFFFFECSLFPMYVLMILLGKGVKKKHYASLSLVFFTLTGSIFLLFGILYLYSLSLSCDFKVLNFEVLDFNSQLFLFFIFLIGFSVKIPIFPFYSWLPEAHVEAATAVSILLAAIFLKVATYGLLKIVVFNFFMPIHYFYSFFFYFSLISIISASLIIIVQTDLKKIIAFSSIIHMNYIVIGLFSLDAKATVASLIYMFSHAFVSSGLFYMVGLFYENTGTRDLLNLSNNSIYSQNFYVFFLLFNLSNISFPLTFSFVSELMLINNLVYLNVFMLLVILFSIFLSVIYTFWMLHSVFFGKNIYFKNMIFFNVFDLYVVCLLLFIIVVLGIFPFLLFYNLEQEIYLLFINKFNIF